MLALFICNFLSYVSYYRRNNKDSFTQMHTRDLKAAIKKCKITRAGNLFLIEDGLLIPKMHELLHCLLSLEYEEMCCVIIGERMLAVVISSLMTRLNYFEYEHINRDKLFGSLSLLHLIV